MNPDAAELSPELELLVLSARQHLTDVQSRRIDDLIAGRLNWRMVLTRGRALGVLGLLRNHLRTSRTVPVPVDVAGFLEQEYRFQALVNLRIRHQLDEIAEALRQLQAQAVLLKGAFLAYWVYADPALRPMSDLDLLCRQEDRAKLDRALQTLGYAPFVKAGDLHPFPSHRTFHRPKSVRVEVHFCLDCDLDTAEAISRSQPLFPGVFPDSSPFLTLRFEDLVEYLVAHLSRHVRAGSLSLIWFADIHELACRAEAGFEAVAPRLSQQAARLPSGSAAWSFLMKHWVDSRIGSASGGHAGGSAAIVRQIRGHRIVPIFSYLDPVRKVRQYRGVVQKIRYLRWLFFPSPGYLTMRGQLRPGGNIYLHYLYRTLALPVRAVWSAFTLYRVNSRRR